MKRARQALVNAPRKASLGQRVQARNDKRPTSEAPGSFDLGDGALVTYCQDAFQQPARIFQTLQDQVPWEHKEITVMGRQVMQPRMVAYMADDTSMHYTYSHTTLTPHPWLPAVAAIKETVECIAQHRFNSCLLNLYRTGSDHLSWHSDNEPLYGDVPVIGSASFGAARSFVLRRNCDHLDKRHFLLGSGDVLVMSGSTQQHWMHSVPKRARVTEARINLTFRQILPQNVHASASTP